MWLKIFSLLFVISLSFIHFGSAMKKHHAKMTETGTGGESSKPIEANISTKTIRPLSILLMIPVYEFNRSHVNYAISIYRALRRGGHSVYFVVPSLLPAAGNYLREMMQNDKDLQIEFYTVKNGEWQHAAEEEILYMNRHGRKVAIWMDMLENVEIMKKLKRGGNNGRPFDVGIAEMALPNEYALAVFDALNIPHIVVTKAYSLNSLQYHDLGLLEKVIHENIPPVDGTKLGDHNDTRREVRRVEIKQSYEAKLSELCDSISKSDKKFAHFQNLPTFKSCNGKTGTETIEHHQHIGLRGMINKAEFVLLNTQLELEFDEGKLLHSEEGMGRKVQPIGGIHLKAKEELKRPLDEINEIRQKMESLKNGAEQAIPVVLISFGTVVNTTQPEYMNEWQYKAILNAIRAMPHTMFIWQLSQGDVRIEELNREEPNVYSNHWVDQQSILADTRTKAFVSHCGRNSQLEAAFHGVALICVPNFQDQYYNAESNAHHKMAIVLDYYCIQILHASKSLLVSAPSFNEHKIEKIEDKEKAMECFTSANIKHALNEAINPKLHQQIEHTEPQRIDVDKIRKVKEEMQKEEKSPQTILLQAMEQIQMKILNAH